MALPKESQPRAPLALAAAAFACGIWLASHLQNSPILWGWTAALLALCAISSVIAESAHLAWLSTVLALVCTGAFARVGTPAPRINVVPQEFLETKDVEIVGHVTNDGLLL